MKIEYAQPQTIEAEDGFPIENLKFCGDAQEVMAVIQGHKPVAINDVDTNYTHMDLFTSLKSKKTKINPFHDCEPYTYEQIFKASKRVNLVRYPKKIEDTTMYYYFLKENIKDAYLLSRLWEKKLDLNKYNLDDNEGNILIGILFGYKKKDIRAWFLMELQSIFGIDFDNLDKRSTFVKDPAIQKKREELEKQFEANWKSTIEKYKVVRKDISVPKAWKAKLQKLPSPGSRSTTRKQLH